MGKHSKPSQPKGGNRASNNRFPKENPFLIIDERIDSLAEKIGQLDSAQKEKDDLRHGEFINLMKILKEIWTMLGADEKKVIPTLLNNLEERFKTFDPHQINLTVRSIYESIDGADKKTTSLFESFAASNQKLGKVISGIKGVEKNVNELGSSAHQIQSQVGALDFKEVKNAIVELKNGQATKARELEDNISLKVGQGNDHLVSIEKKVGLAETKIEKIAEDLVSHKDEALNRHKDMKAALEELKTEMEREREQIKEDIALLGKSFALAVREIEARYTEEHQAPEGAEAHTAEIERFSAGIEGFRRALDFEVPGLAGHCDRFIEAYRGFSPCPKPDIFSAEDYHRHRLRLELHIGKEETELPTDYVEWVRKLYRHKLASYAQQLREVGLDGIAKAQYGRVLDAMRAIREHVLDFFDQKRDQDQDDFDMACYEQALVAFLAAQGLEILKIELGVTPADARFHDIKKTEKGPFEPGVVVKVLKVGLRGIEKRELVRKAVVVRGEPA